ncbi:MAG: 16S rRNA processing protein RimM [Alphaproteobacteria bacterium]|nr:16S rRNA processing protein RimM [Alphaproteobacteria bacterium]
MNTNKPSLANEKRIMVAKIATAHGIRGLVKLHIYADDEQLAGGTLYTSENGKDTLDITLKNATAKHWLAAIDGVTDRNSAEALRGTELYVDQDILPEIGEDEFYYSDLIGLPAIDEDGAEIGKIIAVENFGASDLIEIQPQGESSFYLPVSDETLLEITDDKIVISIPEGLLE